MQPIDTTSMFAMLCRYMDRLEKKEVDPQEVFAMTKLVGQANNLLNYELKRAALMTNNRFAGEHRDLEINQIQPLPEPGENLNLTGPDED